MGRLHVHMFCVCARVQVYVVCHVCLSVCVMCVCQCVSCVCDVCVCVWGGLCVNVTELVTKMIEVVVPAI